MEQLSEQEREWKCRESVTESEDGTRPSVEITPKLLRWIFDDAKGKRAPGEDEIPAEVLRALPDS
eukprot:1713427-Alexandrium_andersonii.AAC.1